jgi:hypothetical protein
MERSEIRDCLSGTTVPDCASLHPGYDPSNKTAARSGGRFFFNSNRAQA